MTEERYQDLADNLLLQIRNLVNGNQAAAEDVVPQGSSGTGFIIRALADWRFYAESSEEVSAGNTAAAVHFGSDTAAFWAHAARLEHEAAHSHELRAGFTAELRGADGQGLARVDSKHSFHRFPDYSVHEDCTNCHASGKVRCGSCGGSGRKSCPSCWGSGQRSEQVPEYDYQGNYRGSKTVYKSCYGCGGSGRTTCGACFGRGKVRCGECSGHGFFTRVRHTCAKAAAKLSLKIENAAAIPAFEALSDLLYRAAAGFLAAKIPFETVSAAETDGNIFQVAYRGESTAIRLDFSLHRRQYACCAFSNPPYPYSRPLLFDDLFADELAYLTEKIPAKGRLNKSRAVSFFNRYAGQPVLDEAMRRIAAHRTDTVQNTGRMVQEACQFFIGRETAEALAAALNRIMDKISPAYSAGVWLFFGVPFLALQTLAVLGFAQEGFAQHPIGTVLSSTLSGAVLTAAAGALICLPSMLAVWWRRRKIPAAYRQQMRNREAFRLLFRWAAGLWLAACAYGWAAAAGHVPKIEISLRDAAAQACRSETAQAYLPFCRRPAPPAVDTTLPEAEQARQIQQFLAARGYALKADGKFGRQSRRAARQYLKESGIGLPENAPTAEFYRAIFPENQ